MLLVLIDLFADSQVLLIHDLSTYQVTEPLEVHGIELEYESVALQLLRRPCADPG